MFNLKSKVDRLTVKKHLACEEMKKHYTLVVILLGTTDTSAGPAENMTISEVRDTAIRVK
jgi:hypothetical protein